MKHEPQRSGEGANLFLDFFFFFVLHESAPLSRMNHSHPSLFATFDLLRTHHCRRGSRITRQGFGISESRQFVAVVCFIAGASEKLALRFASPSPFPQFCKKKKKKHPTPARRTSPKCVLECHHESIKRMCQVIQTKKLGIPNLLK